MDSLEQLHSGAGITLPQNQHMGEVLSFDSAFVPTECAQLVALAQKLPVSNVNVYPAPLRLTRRATSYVIPLSEWPSWLEERLSRLASHANRGFQFQVEPIYEPVMLVTYALGDYFDWHTDLADSTESTRKLSFSVQLSDPNEYSGGELLFVGNDEPISGKTQGTAIVFPSYLGHRVTPVSRGTRHALVAWMHGPPFK